MLTAFSLVGGLLIAYCAIFTEGPKVPDEPDALEEAFGKRTRNKGQ